MRKLPAAPSGPLKRERVDSRARPQFLAGTPVGSRRTCFQLLASWLWQEASLLRRGRYNPCLPREKLTFAADGTLSPPIEQVLATLSTAPTLQAAQQALWDWLLPALRASLRQQHLRRLDRLTALFEELEQQLALVNHQREHAPPAGNRPTPGAGKDLG
ncbi:hypothetical protein [Pontibacter liquoris]|uniref:hypothetical protein n=1 Tax=Pontibacter liquoris TaxID=2905677 RepID=UPI001FA6AA47|nr:hypothetical protein [Pontibacter liquoris]